MKEWLLKIFHFLFRSKNNVTVSFQTPVVTKEEAYIPFRSPTLEKYLKSKEVDLRDPLDASIKIRKFLRSTPDTAILKGNIDSKQNVLLKSATNVMVANLQDLRLKECSLIIRSDFENSIVIFNIAGKLSLMKNAKIELRGTLKPENILFNCTGTFVPSVMTNSCLIGTVITLNGLSLLRGCKLEGETIGSEPNVSGGVVVNKTTENMARLQKERLEQLKKQVV